MATEYLKRFLELFNSGAYWESHEVLEGPWRAQGSEFYQGLILYASAFVHAQRGNAHGITAQLDKAEEKLAPFRPAYLGLDVDAILEHADRCRRIVDENPGADAGTWAELIPFPRLGLDRERVRGDEPELSHEGESADLPHHETDGD